MLEGNHAAAAVKRYAPPSQRNRPIARRKSAEKFEKLSYPHGNKGEKGQGSYSRNFPSMDHELARNTNSQSETSHPGLIPLIGCGVSEASELLNEHIQPDTKLISEFWSFTDSVFSQLEHSSISILHSQDGWAATMNSFNDPSIDLSGEML